MQTAINSLLIFCVLGLVGLAVVQAALLRDVRALQNAMADVTRSPRRQVAAFASAEAEDTYVLAVSAHCPACERRSHALADVVPMQSRRVVLLSADAAASAWVAGTPVEVVVDPVLLGELGVDITPLLLCYDADGHERFRRPVGSDDDLHRLLAANPA
ncbi:hypothetical protein AB0B88_15875 [Micromonospora haikouensis]|uniref:hypothetical protein n=1 Tax=Micromonospora haikouensis TaxID=686309 RepID=UPI003408C33F